MKIWIAIGVLGAFALLGVGTCLGTFLTERLILEGCAPNTVISLGATKITCEIRH